VLAITNELDLIRSAARDDEAQELSFSKSASMFDALRHTEYDIVGALGELVDNSVDAGAQNVWIDVKTTQRTYGKKTTDVVDTIVISDDGTGMDEYVLHRCLRLGEHHTRVKISARPGIGRFGVGMCMGGISLGKRIEVYSRDVKDGSYLHTYIDLDEIAKESLQSIPKPVASPPPSECADRLGQSTGTIVIIQKCDRLEHDPVDDEKLVSAHTLIADIPYNLGRIYRKFIHSGLNLWFQGKRVYLHDPLFLMGPTLFDMKDPKNPDPKARLYGTREISLRVPRTDKTAKVIIRMSVLPEQWRRRRGDGGKSHAKERHIDDNEGISIMRADREVLYGKVEYIIGPRGTSRFEDKDRWWGCEISFPPELDEYFQVKFIKRGAEPKPALRDKIREIIAPIVKEIREKEIDRLWRETAALEAKEKGFFEASEQAMAGIDNRLPRRRRTDIDSEEQLQQEFEQIIDASVDRDNAEKREQQRRKLDTSPYAIVPVHYPKHTLFDTKHLLDRTIVMLNVDHPFYTEIFVPLCGSIEGMTEDSDPGMGADTSLKRRTRDAIMILLLSYARAESMFEDDNGLFSNLRMQWGAIAGAVISEMVRGS
jgi:hypothetical protein